MHSSLSTSKVNINISILHRTREIIIIMVADSPGGGWIGVGTETTSSRLCSSSFKIGPKYDIPRATSNGQLDNFVLSYTAIASV